MQLHECVVGDVVDLPHHHPSRVVIDDIPDQGEGEWFELLAFAWSSDGDAAEGITSMSPNAAVTLVWRRHWW